jgi:hypothetical protein
MSDPSREQFKQSIIQRINQLRTALKRFDESEAAYKIVEAGGQDTTDEMAQLQQQRDRTMSMIKEAEKQLAALK